MANFDLSQLLGTPDASVPTAGQMPQQPMVPQQFPISNPLLQAAQGLGGALQGNPNFQGDAVSQNMLPSIPQNKWEALAMLAGPALGMAAGKLGGAASKTLSIVDSGQKDPLGGIIYRLARGKENLPFFGTQDELYNIAQKMGQKIAPPTPAAPALKVGDRVAYKDDPLSIATIRTIGNTKATVEDAVAKRTVPIEKLVPKPLGQDMIEYYRQRPEEIRQAMPDVVEHLPSDVLDKARNFQSAAKSIPNTSLSQETPEIQKYLGHDVPTRMLDTARQLEPNGGPVSTNRLRQALPDVSKQDFDAAAMQLRDSGRAQLSLHSNYRNLTPAQQADMIAGEIARSEITGTPYQRYYNAIAPKDLGNDLETRITNAYNQLDAATGGRGNTVTFYRMRQLLPDISKQDFDQAVLRMTTGQKSQFLKAYHDSAHGLKAVGGDVSDLVHDPNYDPMKDPGYNNPSEASPKGRYYVSMYKR